MLDESACSPGCWGGRRRSLLVPGPCFEELAFPALEGADVVAPVAVVGVEGFAGAAPGPVVVVGSAAGVISAFFFMRITGGFPEPAAGVSATFSAFGFPFSSPAPRLRFRDLPEELEADAWPF